MSDAMARNPGYRPCLGEQMVRVRFAGGRDARYEYRADQLRWSASHPAHPFDIGWWRLAGAAPDVQILGPQNTDTLFSNGDRAGALAVQSGADQGRLL